MAPLNYRTPPQKSSARTYEDEEARKQWLIPVILLSIAVGSTVAQALFSSGIQGASIVGLIYLFVLLIQAVMVTVAAYVTAAVAKVGFGSVWMAVLQLVAITLFASAVISWLNLSVG